MLSKEQTYMAPFVSLKNQAETLLRLIYCERKTLFRLKKQAEKIDYKINEQGLQAFLQGSSNKREEKYIAWQQKKGVDEQHYSTVRWGICSLGRSLLLFGKHGAVQD